MLDNPFGFLYYETDQYPTDYGYNVIIQTGILIWSEKDDIEYPDNDRFAIKSLIIIDEGQDIPDKIIMVREAMGLVRKDIDDKQLQSDTKRIVNVAHQEALSVISIMRDDFDDVLTALLGDPEPYTPEGITQDVGGFTVYLN